MEVANIRCLIFLLAFGNVHAVCRDKSQLWSMSNDVVLTASSEFSRPNLYYGPRNSKLNTKASGTGTHTDGWSAGTNGPGQWIQVDLRQEINVEAVATQGRPSGTQYVKTYLIKYSSAGINWVTYEESGRQKIFSGNADGSTIVKHVLERPVRARYVRLYPLEFQAHISLRWELYGCPLCSGKGILTWSEVIMTASSEWVSSWNRVYNGAENSRLGTQATGKHTGSWSAGRNRNGEYIEADLGQDHTIEAVGTQGRAESDQWVKQYQLKYSMDGSRWSPYKESSRTRTFQGNNNRATIAKHMLPRPFVARFVRLYPTQWHGHISLRWELFGCPVPTEETCEETCEERCEENEVFPFGVCHLEGSRQVKKRVFTCTTAQTERQRFIFETVRCN